MRPVANNLIVCIVALSLAMLLSSCATPTPYQAADPNRPTSEGYHEVRLETQRWRVVFMGNTLTSRETVETYLLYRAAELTLESGYDWFEAVERDTDAHVSFDFRTPSILDGQAWDPHWRYAYGPRSGWRVWHRHGPWPDFDIDEVTAFEAVAEIVTRHGVKPTDNPAAYDARAVKAALEPRIARREQGE